MPQSKWIEHVKKYAAKHRCTYGEALSLARPSYHSAKKGGKLKKGVPGKNILIPSLSVVNQGGKKKKKVKKGGSSILINRAKSIDMNLDKQVKHKIQKAMAEDAKYKNAYELSMDQLISKLPKKRE